ncbi:MAG: transcriptional repressor LexA [Candidatus Pacebacteria bacterium]|nr:transcriptional repressor LexA [Candidatus Paceibacterota bacterium]
MSKYESYKEKIFAFYEAQKRMPSYAEIMELVGFKSKNAVSKLIDKLMDEGLIDKDAQGRLIPASLDTGVPLLGLVEAGIPTMADADMLDSISLDNYLIEDKAKTFILEVKGDSMIEAHIEEGDYVIAERTEDARDRDIVVAEVDGEWTLKYLRKDPAQNTIWLEPANKNYAPIHPAHSLRIAAIVKGVLRKY